MNGYAEPIDAAVPNKLILKLKPRVFGLEIPTSSDGKYFVVGTDYNTYSIVYSCTETNYFFFTLKDEYAFFLSRSKNPNNMTIAAVKSKLSLFIDPTKLVFDTQDCDN